MMKSQEDDTQPAATDALKKWDSELTLFCPTGAKFSIPTVL